MESHWVAHGAIAVSPGRFIRCLINSTAIHPIVVELQHQEADAEHKFITAVTCVSPGHIEKETAASHLPMMVMLPMNVP